MPRIIFIISLILLFTAESYADLLNNEPFQLGFPPPDQFFPKNTPYLFTDEFPVAGKTHLPVLHLFCNDSAEYSRGWSVPFGKDSCGGGRPQSALLICDTPMIFIGSGTLRHALYHLAPLPGDDDFNQSSKNGGEYTSLQSDYRNVYGNEPLTGVFPRAYKPDNNPGTTLRGDVTAVPESPTMPLLLISGFVTLLFNRKKRRK